MPALSTSLDLPNMTYYFISGNIPDKFGGLTTSLLLRSKLFGELKHTPTYFLTFGFDSRFKEKEEQFYNEKRIHPDFTRLINMYDSFLSDISKGKRAYSERIDLNKIKHRENQSVFMKKVSQLFTSSKEDQKVTWFEDSDHIQFVDYTDEHKREEYRRDGTLATVSYFHSDSENPYLIEYINKDNLVYLDKIFTTNNKTEESALTKINWYSDQGLQSFSRETDLRQFWIKQIQKASTEPKLFLIDSRPQDRHILNVPKEKTHIMPL